MTKIKEVLGRYWVGHGQVFSVILCFVSKMSARYQDTASVMQYNGQVMGLRQQVRCVRGTRAGLGHACRVHNEPMLLTTLDFTNF